MSNRLVDISEMYQPSVSIVNYSTDKVGLNTPTQISMFGTFLEFINSVSVTSSIDSLGVNVSIVSKTNNELVFELVSNSELQNYTLTFTDGQGNTHTHIVEGLNITTIIPNNSPISLGQAIWENKTGEATTSGNTGVGFIQKPSASSGWNTQGTFGVVPANSDFELSFELDALNATTSYGMIGMNISNTTASYSDIDFAFYLQNNSNIYCYENGSSRGLIGNHSASNSYKIKRAGNVITYIINNNIVRTVNNATTSSLIFDCSLYRAVKVYSIQLTIFN